MSTPKPTSDDFAEASACRLKHGDTVFFTVSTDESGEYLVAHCVVCGATRPDYLTRALEGSKK